MSDFPLSLLDSKSASASMVRSLEAPSRVPARESRPRQTLYIQFDHRPSPVKWYSDTALDGPVSRTSRAPTRWIDLYESLEALRNLAEDWDTYGATIPNAAAIANARTVIDAAMLVNLRPTGVLPSAEGGVFISFDSGGRHANVECLNDGDMYAAIRDPLDVWPVAVDESIENTIGRIARHLSGDRDCAVAL